MSRSSSWASSVAALRNDIPRRFKAPWKSITFILHLTLGLIAGGGLGIWYTLHCQRATGFDMGDLATAIFTVFPGIAATTLLELQNDKEPYWKSFGLFLIVPFAALFYFSATNSGTTWGFAVSIFSIIFALALWCTAVGENPIYNDVNPGASTPPPQTPMQGDPSGWKR